MKTLKIKDKDKLFFTSDMHFGHDRIIELCERKMKRSITEPTAAGARGSIQEGYRLFTDADEMNEELIKRWNEIVPKDAIVVDLGDMFFRIDKFRVRGILKRLNFRELYCVKGNHGLNYYSEFENIGRKVKVYHDTDIVHIIVDDEEFDDDICEFMACHYPLVEHPRQFKGAIGLYGHTHRDHPNENPMSVHVGIDSWALQPVSYFEVLTRLFLKNAKSKLIDESI